MLRTRRVGRVVTLAVTSAVTVLVLGLSSCGSTGPRISAGKGPTIIHLTSGQNPGRTTLPAAASVDGMMRPFGDVTYVFDGAFPDLGATAGSWSFVGGAQPDLAGVAAMAKALGVNGDVHTLPTDQGGGWAVGPNDGTAPTFVVSADGLLTWWYSSAASTVSSGCAVSSGSVGSADTASTAVASPPDQGSPPSTMIVDGGSGQGGAYPTTSIVLPAPEPCLPPPAPQGVLDKATAEARAKALMSQMGLDAAKYQLTTYADPYSASVSGQLLIDGKPSQISFSIGFGAEGAITYASGQLAEPKPGDVYPIVSGDIAIQRLNDHSGKWQFFGSPGVRNMAGLAGGVATNVATTAGLPPAQGAPSVAPGAPATIVDPASPVPMPSCPAPATMPPGVTGDIAQAPCADTGCYEAASSDSPNSQPVPVAVPCTAPTPAPVTVHLNSVRASLTMVWAQDGSVWLLPAYTFTSTDGAEYTVVAVDEQYLDMPAATVDTTVPPETTVTGQPAATVTTEAELSAPDVATAAKVLVGLAVDEATKVALSNGWQLRVVETDGVSQPVTADLVVNRVNVAVKAGVVNAVNSIG